MITFSGLEVTLNIESKSIPILITSSVFVTAPLVQVTDPGVRVNLILNSIRQWVRIVPDSKVVICDGSGYDFAPEISKQFPKLQIECLSFKNNDFAVSKFGKGYGEGEIIKYALSNSIYLKDCEFFAKCTGKLWVENFKLIVAQFNGNFQCQLSVENPLSIRNIRPSFVDTRFYIANKNFYIENLLNAYKNVRDFDGYYLEHCFKDALIKDSIGVSNLIFRMPPSIRGVSGSSGTSYGAENLVKRCVTNHLKVVMLKLHEKLKHVDR